MFDSNDHIGRDDDSPYKTNLNKTIRFVLLPNTRKSHYKKYLVT